jgi:hypothetical protein
MRCESTRPQLWWVFKDHLQLVYAGRTYPPGYLLKGIPKGFNVREQIRLRQIAEANRSPRSG